MRQAFLTLLVGCLALIATAQTDNTVYVEKFLTPGGTLGQAVAAAQATCNPSSICTVVFDPSLASHPTGTLPPACPRCTWRGYQEPTSTNGYLFSGLPNQSPQGHWADRWYYANFGGKYTSPTGGSLINFHALYNTVTFPMPGWDWGNVPHGPEGWTWRHWYTLKANSFGAGGFSGLVEMFYQYGKGDTDDLYNYYFSRGGTTGTSDQGTIGIGSQGGEEPQTFVSYWDSNSADRPTTGNVSTASSGPRACVSDCSVQVATSSAGGPVSGPALGDRLPFIDTSQKLIDDAHIQRIINGTGEIPGTIILDSNSVPVSTAWGTLTADCNAPAAPHAPQPAGVGTASETCSVNLDGIGQWGNSPGSFVKNEPVCFSGQNHETAIITDAGTPTAGTQTITVSVGGGHEAGSVVMQGGLCGSAYLDVVVNGGSGGVGQGSAPLKTPVDVLGAISRNTLVWRRFAYGYPPGADSFRMGNLILGSFRVGSVSSTSAGAVSMKLLAGGETSWAPPLRGGTVYLDTSNPALNGQCGAFTINLQDSTASCTKSAITSRQTAPQGTIALNCTLPGCSANPYGNGDVNVYAGSQIIDAQDQKTGVIDGRDFLMEPNSWTWHDGDKVEVDHHPSADFTGNFTNLSVMNPGASWQGVQATLNGTGIESPLSTASPYIQGDSTFWGVNETSYRDYAYYGGTAGMPLGLSFFGPVRTLLTSFHAPQIGQPAIALGAPYAEGGVGGSSDPNYWNPLLELLDSKGRPHGMAYYWSSDQFVDMSESDENHFRALYQYEPGAGPSSPGCDRNRGGWYGCKAVDTYNASSYAHGQLQGITPPLTSVSTSAIYSPSLLDISGTISNVVAVATSFRCSARPTFTLEDCGTSTSCSSPTPLGSVTLTAANTITKSAASAALTSGHYLVWRLTAGSCSELQIQASAAY